MIKVMDELLANKIKAGEVVEKIVSVVKELVENSIDAKANEIVIDLIESGTKEIKVMDNGIGMNREDASICFQRHATSKLIEYEDLYEINTLGFRGEALPSIASVSEINLKTSTGEVGTEINLSGGKIINITNTIPRKGTIITIKNLFFNTPARLKHLSSLYAELANVVNFVNKISLSYPDIKFTLSNDSKVLIKTIGNNDLLKTINSIYGIEVAKKMIFISGENNDFFIKGYISYPEINRSTKEVITTIVNGRVIKNYELNKIINDSYHTFKEENKYPIVVLKIDVDPNLVDVNIHPAKLDIKISKLDSLKDLITKTIITKLKEKMLIPEVQYKEKQETPKKIIPEFDFTVSESKADYGQKTMTALLENSWNNSEEEIEELQDEVFSQPVRKELNLEVIGIIHGTYIVCQDKEGMYLIDQHAACERVNYEKYLSYLEAKEVKVTKLLVPLLLEYPLNDVIIIKNNFSLIHQLGFDIMEFGQNSFSIKEVPTWLPLNNYEEAIKKIMDLILTKEKDFSTIKFNDRIAMTVACKMSIKANDNISLEEARMLINNLNKADNPFTCPHGRPVIIKYTIYELEKMFKRVI